MIFPKTLIALIFGGSSGLGLGRSELEFAVTLFLISYASDMLSLLVSCIARSTTAAMTVMPFLLIFQLVFSGGFFTLPGWASNLSKLSVSSYGVRCFCAEAAQKPAYEHSRYNVTACWGALILYTLVCSFLSGMALKLIDKGKR